MATYVVLSTFTEQGIRTVRDTTRRADGVRELARKMGIDTKSLYWTIGSYDVVATFEAPNDEAMTALALALSSQGNVRTQTLRAFSKDEMSGILAKLGQ
ncbi:MAG TPA: GYD domain-containing protein [Casimicrobiaceae bacterium]